ncbi:MAG: 2,3,4,5-tetrahydropyridine-2,6-dicarboxylate N-succinyltransferase [Micavibrio aeruginosavorus]|uniref:2,3,4,5-tetrahydropyridine-2,6-dicarboxylate N-succinyltransferase n=1 Tax=Micavibrio aeruginosavorus TaxID=349221 RepID=A0A7T5R4G3_9BACT|nr:MAG: 2,3,4,5-tetrahydropyridine-2,6-dicarboxylate N-succinyltransferase [Micavibrio aeruginosavorus]
MSVADMETIISQAWNDKASIGVSTTGPIRQAVEHALHQLDRGRLRVAEPLNDGRWLTHEWIKKAILLSFRLNRNEEIKNGPGDTVWWDKVAPKCTDWTGNHFSEAGFRAVPGSYVRHGAFIGKDVVLMPSFVNIGAYVGDGTMVDTWATIGSCAQIGKRCHISGGTGIGGVLEPLQASPVVIEDDVFIGARSEIAEGVRVGQGAVISMGVFIGASTKIVDRANGEILHGHVPPYAVVVPGTLPGSARADGQANPSLACAVIVKRVDAQTRAKTTLNDLLRY